jgi:hypothetical protein
MLSRRGELGPMIFWLLWGITLGMATVAYYQRRKSTFCYFFLNEKIRECNVFLNKNTLLEQK